MAITIKSAKFSFVRFEDNALTLPAAEKFDVAFQFEINGNLPALHTLKLGVMQLDGMMPQVFNAPVMATAVSYIWQIPPLPVLIWLHSITSGSITKAYNLRTNSAEVIKILENDFGYRQKSSNEVYDNGTNDALSISYSTGFVAGNPTNLQISKLWHRGHVQAPGNLIEGHLKIGECFRYIILDSSGIVVGKTNLFKVIKNNKYISKLTYTNNEHAFDFSYPSMQQNSVYLPFYLSRPQWPEKRQVYKFSNGKQKLLSASAEKQYQLKTDYLTAKFHEAFKIALLHDNVIIDCLNVDDTPVQVIGNDSYSAEWDDEIDTETAQGKCTVTIATFGYRNDNCE